MNFKGKTALITGANVGISRAVALKLAEYGAKVALWRLCSDFVDTSTDVWRKYLDVNVMGTVYVTKAVLPKMIENSYGRIINVASVAGVYGNATMAHYSASKGAIISMTKAIAKEITDKGVLINCVSPGSVSPSENPNINSFEPTELAFMEEQEQMPKMQI